MRAAASVLALLVSVAAACPPSLASDVRTPSVRLAVPETIGGTSAAFAGASAGLPGWLRWALTPQWPSARVPGATGLIDRPYPALTWTIPLASGLLQPNDRLDFGISLGNDLGWSPAGGDAPAPGTLQATPTTRLGAAIGYQVTPSIGLYVTYDHVSVSGVGREDEIADELGMRLGLRF